MTNVILYNETSVICSPTFIFCIIILYIIIFFLFFLVRYFLTTLKINSIKITKLFTNEVPSLMHININKIFNILYFINLYFLINYIILIYIYILNYNIFTDINDRKSTNKSHNCYDFILLDENIKIAL